ncbi:MAG: thioredoxin [Euryarchaeota archaeon]|nr:thioredoxin [Euryarchaeota archaeon]
MSEGGMKFKDLKQGDFPAVPVEVGDPELPELTKRYAAVVVDCWAPWCGPCRAMGPTIDELAREQKGKVVFAKLNTDDNEESAMKFKIMAIPTLLFFKKGELVDRTTGLLQKKQLEAAIKKAFG